MILVLSCILPLTCGVGLACMILVIAIKKSNEIGTDSGKLEDFGEVKIIYFKDRLYDYEITGDGRKTLCDHGMKEQP